MSVLVMHKFFIMILLLMPIVKDYITNRHPMVCAIFTIIIMLICYGLGVILSMNPITFFLLGKKCSRKYPLD